MSGSVLWVAIVIAGVAGFICGMLIELFANSMTLRNAREEMTTMRRENILLKRQIASNVEVIEITDNRGSQTEDLFKPW